LRAARPTRFRPGAPIRFPNPEAEERTREQDNQEQERWAAADGYRVLIRLNAEDLETSGWLFLVAQAAPFRSGDAHSSPFSGEATLMLDSGPLRLQESAAPDSPQRQAALEKDPVVGVKRRLKPQAKLRRSFDPDGPWGWRLRDLLPDLARTYGVSIIADAYTNSPSGFLAKDSLAAEPTPLFALLDRLCEPHLCWDCPSGQAGRDAAPRTIRLRSRTWFLDRPREIPQRLVRRWKTLFDTYGALPLAEYARMVSELNEAQLESVPNLRTEERLVLYLPMFLRPGLWALRLYASLSPGEQQALWQGAALPVAQMTPPQRALFLAAARQSERYQMPPPDMGQWAAGSFSMTAQPILETIDWRGTQPDFHFEPAPPAREPKPPAPGHADSPAPPAASPPGGPAPPPAFPSSGLPASAGPAHDPDPVTRRRVTEVNFQFQFGPQERATASLDVASPPDNEPLAVAAPS
jgi:hypothetical protein